jgi:hypothetical protein
MPMAFGGTNKQLAEAFSEGADCDLSICKTNHGMSKKKRFTVK